MTISLSCDTCGRNYQLKDAAAGRKIRCKDCESILSVPELNDTFEDYDDDPWGDSGSQSSKQDDFWDNNDDDWGDASSGAGAYSAPSAYTLQSGGTGSGTSTSRPKKRKKSRSSGGTGGETGKLVGKIAGGLFVALVVVGLIARVGGALGNLNLGALGGSLSWEEFKPPGTPFSIQLPGKPKQSSQFQAGISIVQFMVETRRPERAFGLMHASIPVPAGMIGGLDAADVDEVFQESKQGMILGAPGASVLSENKISVNDSGGNTHPGVELTVAMPYQGKQLKFTYRLYLVGTRMVIVLAGSEERNYSDSQADISKFLSSFKITQPVTAITSAAGNAGGPMGNPPPMETIDNGFTDPGLTSQPPNTFPPAGTNPNPGGQFNNPAADLNRRMQEDAQRRMEESRARLEQMRRESQQRMEEIRNRNRNLRPPGFP